MHPEMIGLQSQLRSRGGLNRPNTDRISNLYSRPGGSKLSKDIFAGMQVASPAIQALLQATPDNWTKRKTISAVKNRISAMLSLNKAFGIRNSLLK